MVPYLRAPVCRQTAMAVYSRLGKMRGPSAGQSVVQRLPELTPYEMESHVNIRPLSKK